MAGFQHARALRKGDRVAVIAPAGPVPAERLEAGLTRLSARYEVARAPGLLTRTGYLAGDDGRRLSELTWALSDPAIKGVFCARGGYGVMRYLPALLQRPAGLPQAQVAGPLVGFSDITVLHAFYALQRVRSVHGPVVTQLGSLPTEDVDALWSLLEDPAPPPPLRELTAARAGRARGVLLGGNLEMLSRLCGTGLDAALDPGEPVILLLEEVGEWPYRIDRALTQLLLSGALRRVAGVVVGELLRCDDPPPASPSGGEVGPSQPEVGPSKPEVGPSAAEVIIERLAPLGVPIVLGAPVGHGRRNRAMPHGAQVELDASAGTLTFLEGAVGHGA